MKAIRAYGGTPGRDPASFELVELADPHPRPHHLLVRVQALAVNPVDTKVRAGLPVRGETQEAPPRLLGWDAAGVVEAIGAAVSGFAIGATQVIDHSLPLGPQLALLGYGEVDAIANFSDTDAYWPVMAELIRPQGAIVAIVGNRQPLDLNVLKAKSVSLHWEFMFTRPQFRTPDRQRQGEILAALASAVEAGELRSTLNTHLTPISPATLAQAHGRLEEGRSIGKIVLEGWPA